MIKKFLLSVFILSVSCISLFSQGVIIHEHTGAKDTIVISGVDSITVTPSVVIHRTSGIKDTVLTTNIDSITYNASINPAPAVTSINPAYAVMGSSGFTITVNGSNFFAASVVKWNGVSLTTSYISKTQLQATVPAANITTSGTASVTVYTPAPGGGLSAAASFTKLSITVEDMETGTKGSYTAGNVTLKTGSWNFSDALLGNLTGDIKNGTQAARIRNSGKLTMLFDLANGVSTVTLLHAKYTGDASTTWSLWYSTDQGTSWTQTGSNITTSSTTLQTASFTVNVSGAIRFEIRKTDGLTARTNIDDITFTDYFASTNPVPAIASISPASIAAGNTSFTLTVTGSSFISSSVIQWNGTNLTTTYVSATELQATISAAYVASAGSATVAVYTPALGGGSSSTLTFSITSGTNPVPVISSLNPASAAAGSAAFTLTVTGSSFVSSSVVKWNAVNLTTTYVSTTQLQAVVPLANVATAGTASITVYTASPGGGTSSALTFPISSASNPVPVLSSISPASATAGSASFTITATGSNFLSSSVIQWNGASLTTTYVSATSLQAIIPAASVSASGTASVTVYTGTPGGGTSSAQSFSIYTPVTNVNLTMGNPSGAVHDVNYPANYLITHGQYCTSYNRDRGIPNWTSWQLNSSWLGSASRGSFITDVSLPSGWYQVSTGDYTGSGFSRGHMCPSADRTASETDNDTVFLMTNMIPQTQAQNGGPWEVLETYCRTLAQAGNVLYIISGPAGDGGTGLNGFYSTIASGKVAVPAQTWKVIMVLPAGTNDVSRVTTSTRCIAVIMNNDEGPFNSWGTYRVSVDAVEALTGYDFFSNVSPAIQAAIESVVDSGPTQ